MNIVLVIDQFDNGNNGTTITARRYAEQLRRRGHRVTILAGGEAAEGKIDRPIHNLLKRQRRKAAKGMPKFRGRKPAKTLQEYKYENKRLRMEVKLLQDFLQSIERM